MLGLAGLGYKKGVAAFWASGGCILGFIVNALWIIRQLRKDSEKYGSITVSDYIERRLNDKTHLLKIISGIIIIIFMLLYVVAQFNGSGKLIEGSDLCISLKS